MNIGEVCTREVAIVNSGEPLLQAVHEMRRRNIGCVVVVEPRGKLVVPIGIVTDRDIARALPEHPGDLGALPAAAVMTRNPLVLREDESIVDAMARLRQRGVRRAPVVAASGELVGIVSVDDLLGIIAEQLGSLARLVERQTRGPTPGGAEPVP
jgi:CBS domain-containing protein